MSIKFAVRLNKKKRIPRINVLRSAPNTSNRGTEVKKYDTLGTIQQFDVHSIEAFAEEKNIDGLDKMELEEGACQLAFNKKSLNSSLENLERKTLYFSADFNQALYKLWELSKKHAMRFCPTDIMQRALLDEAIEMEYALNEKEGKPVRILTTLGIEIEEFSKELTEIEPVIENNVLSLNQFKQPESHRHFAIDPLPSFLQSLYEEDEDENYFPDEKRKKYDYRKSETYKKYRKYLRKMTVIVREHSDFLFACSHYTAIESLLQENEWKKVGETLFLLRDDLLKANHLSRQFKKEHFVISPVISFSNQAAEEYCDALLFYLCEFFSCHIATITSGKKEPSVMAGNRGSVIVAFLVFQLFADFLKEEFSSFVEKCHKNMKRQNKYSRAEWHCENIAYGLSKPLSDDNGETHKLFDEKQENLLNDYTNKHVRRYYDEHMPLGGWDYL